MKNSTEKRLVDLYLSNTDILEEELPHAVNRHRSKALETFNLLGLPPQGSGNGDKYHYTDLKKCFHDDLEHYFTPSYADAVQEPAMPGEGYRITLMNGFYRNAEPLTRLDNGVIYGSLKAAANACGDLVGRFYNSIADNDGDALTALNTAFTQDGAFVYVPRGVRVDRPFLIEYGMYARGESLLTFGRNLIVLEAGAEAQVALHSRTMTGEKFVGCFATEFILEEGSRAEWAELNEVNDRSAYIHCNFARQEQSSRLSGLSTALSGALVRNNQQIRLEGRGAETHTYGLYISSGDEHLDYMTDIEHLSPDCTSYEHFKGIAAERGTGVFNGRIYVAPDAQRTQAYLQNNNLLLGDAAHIYTKPQLEIYADNVKCSHGATVGQLDDEAIYYMRQRGIGEDDARRLQMFGFVNDIINKTSIEGIRTMIGERATARIESF